MGVPVFSELLLALQEGFLEILAFFLIFLARTFAVDKFIPTILAALLMLLLFSKSSKASFLFYYIIFRNTQSVTLWYDRLTLAYSRLSMEASDDILYFSINYYKQDGMIAGQIESIEFESILRQLPKQTQYPHSNHQEDACPARIACKQICFVSFFSQEIIGRRFSFKLNNQSIKLQNKWSFDYCTPPTPCPSPKIAELLSLLSSHLHFFDIQKRGRQEYPSARQSKRLKKVLIRNGLDLWAAIMEQEWQKMRKNGNSKWKSREERLNNKNGQVVYYQVGHTLSVFYFGCWIAQRQSQTVLDLQIAKNMKFNQLSRASICQSLSAAR